MVPETGYRHVEQDHAALHAVALELHGACAKCGCGSLLERMRDFGARLATHFDAEERLWREVDDERLDWSARKWIANLVRDHEDFRGRIEGITRALAAAEAGARPPDDLVGDIRRLLGDLLQHELSESRLFQRAVFENLSGAV